MNLFRRIIANSNAYTHTKVVQNKHMNFMHIFGKLTNIWFLLETIFISLKNRPTIVLSNLSDHMALNFENTKIFRGVLGNIWSSNFIIPDWRYNKTILWQTLVITTNLLVIVGADNPVVTYVIYTK